MRETWYYIVAEFKALGLRCAAHGPEFWVIFPACVGALAVGVVIGYYAFRGGGGDARH